MLSQSFGVQICVNGVWLEMSESEASGYKFYTAWLTGAGEMLRDSIKVIRL
jgi:hypothetical protein